MESSEDSAVPSQGMTVQARAFVLELQRLVRTRMCLYLGRVDPHAREALG